MPRGAGGGTRTRPPRVRGRQGRRGNGMGYRYGALAGDELARRSGRGGPHRDARHHAGAGGPAPECERAWPRRRPRVPARAAARRRRMSPIGAARPTAGRRDQANAAAVATRPARKERPRMSWRLMDRVALLPVTDEQFRILMLLAQRAQDDGTGARPGIKKLMERTGKSERAVQRALHDLQAAGLIVATSYLTGGRGHATEYRLVLPNGDGRGTLSPTTRPETVAPMAPITTAPAVNGATHDALSVTKGATNDALTPVKGDASDAVSPERVPSMTLKGATGGTPIGPEYIRGDAGTSGRRNEEGVTGEGRASPRPP